MQLNGSTTNLMEVLSDIFFIVLVQLLKSQLGNWLTKADKVVMQIGRVGCI